MRVFVTGASGWIGSAVVPELINAGHHVIGLARSEKSAAALAVAGAEPCRGDLDDLDTLASTAAASDGVIHLAFKHEEAFSGNFDAAADADRRAIETFGAALGGRPFVIASGLAGHGNGAVVTEEDQPDPNSPAGHRTLSERAALALSGSSVRLPPTVHGEGDNGFTATLVQIAHDTGVSGYIGDGSNTWPAVHRSDAAWRGDAVAVDALDADLVDADVPVGFGCGGLRLLARHRHQPGRLRHLLELRRRLDDADAQEPAAGRRTLDPVVFADW